MSQLKDYQINFINEAMRVGALEFGTFTLKSGRQSPYFFNASKLLFDADINIIIEGFAHKFLEFGSDINQLFGPAYKGTIFGSMLGTVSYTHLRAHETDSYLVCRLLLEKKK